MDGPEVVVVRTGTANVASVVAGLRRAGARARVSDGLADVTAAPRLVLPGVGTLGAAMEALGDGRDRALVERVEAGRPTLAICLGLQILCAGSDESPEATGLGVIPGRARRFAGPVRVPQLGWNRVEAGPGCRLLEGGYAYFANSYALAEVPRGFAGATADHGGRFVAAVERGAVLGCQFHPELSGAFGLALIARWLEAGGPGGATC